MKMKNRFHINGFALSLALKQRLEATRKWPIVPFHFFLKACWNIISLDITRKTVLPLLTRWEAHPALKK